MNEDGNGIELTRNIQTPFVPYNNLAICGQQIDVASDPDGFIIKNVVWDMDRELFRAKTYLICHDLPIDILDEPTKICIITMYY